MITIFSSWGYNARKWLSLSIRGVYFQIRRNIRQDVQIDIIISSTWLAQDSERATKTPYLAMPRMMTKVLVLRILFLFKMRSCYTFFPIKDTSFFTVVISSLGSMNHWGCCSKVSECTTTAVSISKKNFLAYFWEYNLSRRCFQIIYLQKRHACLESTLVKNMDTRALFTCKAYRVERFLCPNPHENHRLYVVQNYHSCSIFMPLFRNANRVIEAVLEEMLMNHSSSFAALFQGHFCHIVTRTQNERRERG